MQIVIESTDPKAAAPLREFAATRARFVMRRLAWLAPQARIRFSDLNGPRGGVDKRCTVELKTFGVGTVVITSVARDSRAALDGALARAARALLRTWKRRVDRLHDSRARTAKTRLAAPLDEGGLAT